MDLFRSQDFASRIEDLMRQHHVPGLAVAVFGGDRLASAGYGKACMETSEPCTADTLFNIASSSKSFTAASVALLVDDDEHFPEVRYDALMSELLPEDFVMPGTEHKGVTIDDVLGHRTGMPRHDSSYMGPKAAKPDDARSVTRNVRNLPVAAPIRSRYMYSNIMYTVVSHLVEVKTQQPFSRFLDERFFQPLDMQSSNLQPTLARANGLGQRLATGYAWDKENSTYKIRPMSDCVEGQGAGSIITSVNDCIKWVRALAMKEPPISESVFQGLVRLRSIPAPHDDDGPDAYTSPSFYAAGLEVHYYRGHTVIGHDGAVTGFGSKFVFLPDLKFGTVFLGNEEATHTIATILIKELIDSIIGVAARPKEKHLPSQDSHVDQSRKNKQEGLPTRPTLPDDDPATPNVSLSAYTGSYTNAGYHTFTVQIKNNVLFVDATDRSCGFTLTFTPVKNWKTKQFIARFNFDIDTGEEEDLEARFELDDGGNAVRLGVKMEPELDDFIWFERDVEDVKS